MKSTIFTPKEKLEPQWYKIDFVKCKNNNTVVLTTGIYSDTTFEGIIMHSNNACEKQELITKTFQKCYYEKLESGSSLIIHF